MKSKQKGETLGELLLVFLAVFALILLCMGIMYLVHSTRCSSQAKMMGTEHDYALFQGCMIKIKGKWIPLQNYRNIED